MIFIIGMHTSENTKFIRMLAGLGQKINNLDAALAMLAELPTRAQKFTVLVFGCFAIVC